MCLRKLITLRKHEGKTKLEQIIMHPKSIQNTFIYFWIQILFKSTLSRVESNNICHTKAIIVS